ncbi:MAG: electron transport complex subunit RsxB [Legionella sp.]
MVSVTEIDDLLPQTQCGECDFAGCRPYAEAIARGAATIDRCPPGGISTMLALSKLLNIEPSPFRNTVLANSRKPSVALINEQSCIGCTKCIQACPVDAIIGATKLMHTVLADECTGCGLCVEPCPVDCIDMVEIPNSHYNKSIARERFNARQIRQLREQHEKQQNYRNKRTLMTLDHSQQEDKQAKQNYILQAMARVKAKNITHE